MLAIPLGKIIVTTAGTPVALTVPGSYTLPASGCVRKVEVWADPGMTGTAVYVKVGTSILAALPKPASGFAAHWSTPETDGDVVNPTSFEIDAQTSGDGAFVTLWVE